LAAFFCVFSSGEVDGLLSFALAFFIALEIRDEEEDEEDLEAGLLLWLSFMADISS
jgi:hypothetical protein